MKGGFNEEISKLRNKKIYSFGVKDEFVSHATREEQLEECDLSIKAIKENFEKIIGGVKTQSSKKREIKK